MLEYVNETLKKIDTADTETKAKMIAYYGAKTPFDLIFSLNFREDMNLGVPEGTPPLSIYKRDEAIHMDLTVSHLAIQMKRIKSLYQNRDKLTKTKKEYIFLQVLEAIPYQEADVLIYAKDHALTELYPTITYSLMESIFPQYCSKKLN